jgi:hypothetical protein
MSNFYDDGKFGVINRQWFGLSKKWGGGAQRAGGFRAWAASVLPTRRSRRTSAAGIRVGPIKMLKAGSFVLATLSTASATTITGV